MRMSVRFVQSVQSLGEALPPIVVNSLGTGTISEEQFLDCPFRLRGCLLTTGFRVRCRLVSGIRRWTARDYALLIVVLLLASWVVAQGRSFSRKIFAL